MCSDLFKLASVERWDVNLFGTTDATVQVPIYICLLDVHWSSSIFGL